MNTAEKIGKTIIIAPGMIAISLGCLHEIYYTGDVILNSLTTSSETHATWALMLILGGTIWTSISAAALHNPRK